MTKQNEHTLAAPIKKAPGFRLTVASNGWIIRTNDGTLLVCREWNDLTAWMRMWASQVQK